MKDGLLDVEDQQDWRSFLIEVTSEFNVKKNQKFARVNEGSRTFSKQKE